MNIKAHLRPIRLSELSSEPVALQRNKKQTWRCLRTGADFEAQASAAAQPALGLSVVILGEAESARSLCLSLPHTHMQPMTPVLG